MYEGENAPTILDILLLYLVFFVLLYPTTCILLILNVAKKSKWYVHSIKGIISLAFDIMLSHFKVCFMAWVISTGVGAKLALILMIVVGVIAKLTGYDTAIAEDVFTWTQIIVIGIGQIVGYVVTIKMHNGNV